ncbi:hypothetical protein HPB47_020763, partial [Ixodes persulcatus]
MLTRSLAIENQSDMPFSKDGCGVCSEPFIGRMQFLQCSGDCGFRFHCKCIGVIGDELEFFMKTGSSTYKCKSCTKRNGSDEVSVIAGSHPSERDDAATASASSSCSACGCVNNLLQALHDKFDSLIKEVASVRADNASLHLHLARNTELLRRFTAQAVLPPPITTSPQVPGPEPASFASVLGRDSRNDDGKATPGSTRSTIHKSSSKPAVTVVSSALRVQPFHLVDQEMYRKHGRLFGVFEDGRPALYVADPDLLKLVLVADYGDSERKSGFSCDDALFDNMVAIAPFEKWRRIRAAITPLFTASKLRKMHGLVQDLVVVSTEALINAAREGADVDPTRLYIPTALNILSRCTFGKEIDCGDDARNDIISSSIRALYVPISFSLIVSVRTFMKKVRSKFIRNEAFYFYKELCLNIVKKKQLNIN